jgi:hypothetical protein
MLATTQEIWGLPTLGFLQILGLRTVGFLGELYQETYQVKEVFSLENIYLQ